MTKHLLLCTALLAAAGETARADVGCHVGIATPMVSFSGTDTTTIADGVTVAHPIGVTVKKTARLAIDFEVVVANPVSRGGMTSLTIDPGVIYNWGAFATGLRVAVNVGTTSNYGVIPLINKGFDLGNGTAWFIEAAFPTFYDLDLKTLSTQGVLHTGIGF